jgi:hypothetical protein
MCDGKQKTNCWLYVNAGLQFSDPVVGFVLNRKLLVVFVFETRQCIATNHICLDIFHGIRRYFRGDVAGVL